MERLTNSKEERKGIGAFDYWLSDSSFSGQIDAFKKLAYYEDLEEQGRLMKAPCTVGDTVFDLAFGDDKEFHIVEMKVCSISLYGDLRKEMVWNVYLEDDYTKAYRSFYDFGKTVFLTRVEAEEALRKMNETEE